MSVIPQREMAQAPDWDDLYRRGTPAWETNRPAAELVRAVEDGLIRPCSTLELGCGSGADAIYLAQQGFEVTAVDCAAIALERAHVRAEQSGALVRFVLDDVFEFTQNEGPFELIYDAGFYHCVRQYDLERHLDMLWRITRPGSIYFALIGATGERADGGPPRVSKDDVYGELGRMFDFVHLRRFQFESPLREKGYRGWSCLMKRPEISV
jgi:SAM-dependent methyltransferase